MITFCTDWTLVPNSDASCDLWEGDEMARCVDVYSTISEDYTPTISDCVMFVDASGVALTMDLPDTTNLGGKLYTFVKIDNTANAVTIDGNGNTINGITTYTLSTQYNRVRMICDGSNWIILNT
jgi:hypothetical protein